MQRNETQSLDDEPHWLKLADSTLSDLMSRDMCCSQPCVAFSASSGREDLLSEGLKLQCLASRVASEASQSVGGRRKRRIRYASQRMVMATRWLVEAVGDERGCGAASQVCGHAFRRGTLSEMKRPREHASSHAPPRKRRNGGAIAYGTRLVEIL